jgi:hypothetical protein
LPLGGILLIPSRLRRKRLIALITLSFLVIIIVSCGGGSGSSSGGGGGYTDPGTPPGNYSVTVTATSGSLSHSFNFTLMVQLHPGWISTERMPAPLTAYLLGGPHRRQVRIVVGLSCIASISHETFCTGFSSRRSPRKRITRHGHYRA